MDDFVRIFFFVKGKINAKIKVLFKARWIPVRSPIVFVNHAARRRLALRRRVARLVLLGLTDMVCEALACPTSTVGPTSHPCSLPARWLHAQGRAGTCSSGEDDCPGTPSIFIPGHEPSVPSAAGVGRAKMECCTAVRRRISELPQREPSPPSGGVSWQWPGDGVRVAGLATRF